MSDRQAGTDPEDHPADDQAPEVGSVGEETLRLIRALGAQRTDSRVDGAEQHACPTGWCPICQVAGFVRDNPEVIDRVAASAGSLVSALRDLVDAAITPQERP